MAKKKTAGKVDKSRLVMVPEVAVGSLFVEVAYEHRCHHGRTHECCGLTFEPGHVMTFRNIKDVPEAMLEDKLLKVRAAKMGACRLQTTLHYTPMSGPDFNVLAAEAEAAKAAAEISEVVAETTISEPAAEVVAGGDQLEGGE